MNEDLANMKSKYNSFEFIKEKYQKGIIDAYYDVLVRAQEITNGYMNKAQRCREVFDGMHGNICEDTTLLSNSRWGIVGKKNLFGLTAILFPEQKETGEAPSKTSRFYLHANARKIPTTKI